MKGYVDNLTSDGRDEDSAGTLPGAIPFVLMTLRPATSARRCTTTATVFPL